MTVEEADLAATVRAALQRMGADTRPLNLDAAADAIARELAGALSADLAALLAKMEYHVDELHAGWKRSKDQDVKAVLALKRGTTRFWAGKVRALLGQDVEAVE